MSRFRARTAPSDEDRTIALCLDRATREVETALRLSQKVRTVRSRRVRQELLRVLGSIQEVGSITPRHANTNDTDLMSEDQREVAWRKKREEERLTEQVLPSVSSEVTSE